jgi:uncharacterized protein YgiM (DUF1202 family)
MLRAPSYLLIFSTILSSPVFGDGSPTDTESGFKAKNSYQAFTGRISRDKVRLRLNPTTDSPIVKELKRGEMLLVTGEQDDFYAVKPISGTKVYVYRTYILDGVVEGSKVNVRLEPHLEAPVVAQLQSGDRISGTISEKNSKWLEIDPPTSTTFFISADFVEKIGDAGFLARFEKRKDEVNDLLNGTYLVSQQELQKPFAEIIPERVVENYQKLIKEYAEFPDEVKEAKTYLAQFQDAYLRKKVEYLEDKTRNAAKGWVQEETRHVAVVEKSESPVHPQQNRVHTANDIYKNWVHEQQHTEVNARMALWIPVEIAYYEQWAKKNDERPIQDFYQEQKSSALALRGVIEPYDRPVRNKPGDYLLVNKSNRLPIAYVYSTQINLQNMVGREVSLEAVLRPNNNFAYPAYFILSVE